MLKRQQQIMINIESYEKLVADNFTQIAELERHAKELKRMNKVFIRKMQELTYSYNKRG